MEFLKIVKRRSFLSEVVYITLNVALAIGLMLIVRTTNSLLPAFGLVLLSRWRVLAVRPRYWFANIQGDLVSLIVSVSFVVFLYSFNIADIGDFSRFISQGLLVALYILWLIYLKPKSKRRYVALQAGTALFTGVTAIFTMGYGWDSSLIILTIWLVGYATARHVLNTYDEETHVLQLSLVWGLVLAEIGWLAYHWTIAYRIPIMGQLLLPQVSIIMLSLGFLAYKAYNLYFHFQKIRLGDIFLPLTFVVNIFIVLIFWFNSPLNTDIAIVSLLVTIAIVGAVEGVIYFLLRQKFFSKR